MPGASTRGEKPPLINSSMHAWQFARALGVSERPGSLEAAPGDVGVMEEDRPHTALVRAARSFDALLRRLDIEVARHGDTRNCRQVYAKRARYIGGICDASTFREAVG